MPYRWIAAVLAGAAACAAGCKDDLKAVPPPTNARLPPVGGASGAGPGLPPVGSGLSAPPTTGGTTAADAARALPAPAPDAGSGANIGTTPTTNTATGSNAGGSNTRTISDCDVQIAVHDTRIEWTGGATGSAPIEHGRIPAKQVADAVAPLDDHYCRAVFRPDATIPFATLVAAMQAVLSGRYLKLRIVDSAGTELYATPPDTGAAGTAVRDATLIVVGKADVRIGDQVPTAIDDAELATKVATALAAHQAGARGVMAIVQVEADTPYKVLGAVLTAVKTRGFDSVIFARN